MEDIEDVVGASGAPPGFRLPLSAVGMKPKKPKARVINATLTATPNIPGTQVHFPLDLFVWKHSHGFQFHHHFNSPQFLPMRNGY